MNIIVPTKTTNLARTQLSALFFNYIFQHSRVVQKLRIVNILQSRRGFKELCVKRMAWSVEKCNGNGVGTTRMGLVRPAMEDNAEEAIEAVKTGKVIAVPTDTLYGFACDACSVEAVKQIYEIKGRKYTSPLAICVGDVQDILITA